MSRIFLAQEESGKCSSPKWSIFQIVLAAGALLGLSPIFSYGFLGWQSPDPIQINWAWCLGGLGLTVFCSFFLKKV